MTRVLLTSLLTLSLVLPSHASPSTSLNDALHELAAEAGFHALASNGHGQHNQSSIQWEPCNNTAVSDSSLSCGFLKVPLDYHDPSIGNARLALIKANATGERRGSVFFNPGGPGGSGLVNLQAQKDQLLALSGGVYDVISWDPRGVGLTVPGEVYCFESLAEYSAFFDGTIELNLGIEETGNFSDPADVDALFAQANSLQSKYEESGKKCLDSPSGKYLKYMGTAVAVRDMVSIADALDGPDKPINYMGISYGTLIGSWFVNMFPERVGRVVIDGVLDPVFYATQEVSTNWGHQLVSADDAYKGFITGCALAGPSGCAIAKNDTDTPLDVDATIQALLKAAHDAARANPSAPLTSGQLRFQLYTEMYFPNGWASLANEAFPQIAAIVKGESSPSAMTKPRIRSPVVAPRAPWLMQRQSTPNDSPSFTDLAAIYCADSVDVNGTTMHDVFESVIERTRNVSHLFGARWITLSNRCSFWPVRSVERYQGPFNKTLANTILVVSTLYDPITPLPAAELVADLLGDDATLVKLNGFGHTAMLTGPSACINGIYAAYMTNGTLPANNTVCEVDADFEVFPGVKNADIMANLPSVDV